MAAQQSAASHEDPPRWYTPAALAALVWNIVGVLSYISWVTMDEAEVAALEEGQRALYEGMPIWATSAFALATWCGALGGLGLVLRKAWAAPFLGVSLAAVIVQDVHAFVVSDAADALATPDLVLAGVIAVVAVVLLLFAVRARRAGWLS